MAPRSGNIHPMLSALPPSRMRRGKIVSAEDAVRAIRDGDTVATGGFVSIGVPEEILIKIEECYLATGKPRNLTLVYAAGQGDGKDRGLNHFGHEGLVKRVIGGHWGLAPKLGRLAIENKIEAYNLPQGVISHMFRDISARKPRTLTTNGMWTYVDPRFGGGKLNEITREDLVEMVSFDGTDYLAYKTFPINAAILRGTTADTEGNITMEKEALTQDALSIAMAAKNSGGFVIVQVERIADRGSLNARQVKIGHPCRRGPLATREPLADLRRQYNPYYSGEIRVPMDSLRSWTRARARSSPAGLLSSSRATASSTWASACPRASPAWRMKRRSSNTSHSPQSPGSSAGLPAGVELRRGGERGLHHRPAYQFDFYGGGGLDCCFLGLAQADAQGNLNVSRFGSRLAGAGGFIDISQNARKVVFMGTFTTDGLKVSVKDGLLKIRCEGAQKKFLQNVEQVTFSGRYAVMRGQPVSYVTERCVFTLTEDGMELVEVAPGVDIGGTSGPHGVPPGDEEAARLMDPGYSGRPMNLKGDIFGLDPGTPHLRSGRKALLCQLRRPQIRKHEDIRAVEMVSEILLSGKRPIPS